MGEIEIRRSGKYVCLISDHPLPLDTNIIHEHLGELVVSLVDLGVVLGQGGHALRVELSGSDRDRREHRDRRVQSGS